MIIIVTIKTNYCSCQLTFGWPQFLFGFMSHIHLGNNPLRAVWRSGRVFRKDWAGDWTTQSSLPVVDRHHWLVCWRPDVNFIVLKIVCCCRFLSVGLKILGILIELPEFLCESKGVPLPSPGWRCRFHWSTGRNQSKRWFWQSQTSLASSGRVKVRRCGPGADAGAAGVSAPCRRTCCLHWIREVSPLHCDASQPPLMPPDKNNFLTFFFSSSCRCVPVPKPFHPPHNFFKAAWNRFHLSCFSSVIKF